MGFTPDEIAEHTLTIEQVFWSRRRPKLNIRHLLREGQRFEGQSIILYFARPAFSRPTEWLEEPIAKMTYVRTQQVWRLFWMRADRQWHGYPHCRETKTLAEALSVIEADAAHCLFGQGFARSASRAAHRIFRAKEDDRNRSPFVHGDRGVKPLLQ